MTRKKKTADQKPVSGSSEASGAQKRKLASSRKEEDDKLAKVAAKFFKPDQQVSSGLLKNQQLEESGPEMSEEKSSGDEMQDAKELSMAVGNLSEKLQSPSGILEPRKDGGGGGERDPKAPEDVTEQRKLSNAATLTTMTGLDMSDHGKSKCPENADKDEISDSTVGSPYETLDNHEMPCTNLKTGLGNDAGTALHIHDPSTWPSIISLPLKHRILSSPPHYEFKTEDSDLSKFWTLYSTGKKANNEVFSRSWLLISKTSSSAFCLACCLFAGTNSTRTTWSDYGHRGFHDFHHGLRGVSRHEESMSHQENMASWKRYLSFSNNPSSLSSMFNKTACENISEWRLILRAIVDAVLWLAENNLAFQGHSHNILDNNCGNFLNLIKLLAKYYAPLSAHVERLRKGSTSYLSPKIQNEFILLCGEKIKSKLLDDIRGRKYYSIMFDSTPDISHKEQVSQIIRSVECTESGCYIHENFIDFISTTAKTGAALTDEIVGKLEADNLDLLNCRGQGYDNGSNMSGCFKGVQARIKEKNPQANFVPCAAHTLNLVGVNAAEKVLPAKLLLGTIQNVYSFFAGSPARWEVLTSKTKVTLKCQSSTRWSSKAEAVSAMWNNFADVIEALTDITASEKFRADVLAAAESRLNDILSFKFLLGLSIWEQLLSQINLCNVDLQKSGSDVSLAEKKLKVLCKWLEEFKNSGFEMCTKKATDVANDLGIPLDSGFATVRRGRGLNPKYNNPTRVAAVKKLSNEDRFRAEFFDATMDMLTKEMSARFSQLRTLVKDFGFLWGNGLRLDNESRQDCVKNLCINYPNDFNGNAFVNELQTLKMTLEQFQEEGVSTDKLQPLDVLNTLYRNGLESTYPNCETALRIFLTMPVSVASNERAFSKLKLIKNYLRSSMGQERLSGLAIISIEKDISKNLDFDNIINDFIAAKCRRVGNI